jgi:hypothetical protein
MLVLSFSSDWLFPTYQARELVDALNVPTPRYRSPRSRVPTGTTRSCSSPSSSVSTSSRSSRWIVAEERRGRPGSARRLVGEVMAEMTAADLLRADLRLITELVPEGSRVLDLGCGDGSLLVHLRDEKGARFAAST